MSKIEIILMIELPANSLFVEETIKEFEDDRSVRNVEPVNWAAAVAIATVVGAVVDSDDDDIHQN